jgi:hypothetical protein
VYFSADNLALVVAQAACVALPGAGLPAWAQRLRARWWALVLPLSIAVVVAAIAAAHGRQRAELGRSAARSARLSAA